MNAKLDIAPGDIFTYRERPKVLRARSGGGQVLGVHTDGEIIFLRVFDVSGDELKPFIEFLPITISAYAASKPKILKRLDLPAEWETLRDEWQKEWILGHAGVFSVRLREVTHKTLETVNHFRDFRADDCAFVELAYPKISSSGEFDTIAAYVQSRQKGVVG